MKNFLSRFFEASKPDADLTLSDVQRARERLQSRSLPTTPLTFSPAVSELCGKEVFFKWENKFKTGSFKERGALNFLLALPEALRDKGVCAASAGNHALALSYHAQSLGIPCHIVMPWHAALVKVQATKNQGAKVMQQGATFDEAYAFAEKFAKDAGLTYVPAFNHPEIIAGQGTAGLEILEQQPDVDAVIVPVGGGGLVSGIALSLKSQKPSIFVAGARSEWASQQNPPPPPEHNAAFRPSTIADGVAVKSIGTHTNPLIQRHVDKLIAMSESDIAKAIIAFLEYERVVVEGAGAVGLAALLKDIVPATCSKVVVVVSGSNIDMNLLSRLIERDMGERERLMKVHLSVPDRPGSLSAAAGVIAQLGANVLEVFHERSFTRIPGNVLITFVLEVKDREHKQELLNGLRKLGIDALEIDSHAAVTH